MTKGGPGFNQSDSVLHISIRFSVPGYGLCECYVGSDFAGFVGSEYDTDAVV